MVSLVNFIINQKPILPKIKMLDFYIVGTTFYMKKTLKIKKQKLENKWEQILLCRIDNSLKSAWNS